MAGPETMNNMNHSVKGAVAVAMEYVRSLEDVIPSRGLRLEETALNQQGRWLITLSFIDSDTLESRVYKTFEVDLTKREVKSMKIRDPEQPLD